MTLYLGGFAQIGLGKSIYVFRICPRDVCHLMHFCLLLIDAFSLDGWALTVSWYCFTLIFSNKEFLQCENSRKYGCLNNLLDFICIVVQHLYSIAIATFKFPCVRQALLYQCSSFEVRVPRQEGPRWTPTFNGVLMVKFHPQPTVDEDETVKWSMMLM